VAAVEASGGQIEGYILGKAEGLHENWHGHVTAVTVAPEYRRLGVASLLMEYLEHVSGMRVCRVFACVCLHVERGRSSLCVFLILLMYTFADEVDKGYFVDLYVRASNAVAIDFYARRGYVKYRQVIGYYAGEEDAFDMRKALSRDPEKKSEVPLPHPVYPSAGD
jgi:N-terminal acetyltransferase B complex catalytic subunit